MASETMEEVGGRKEGGMKHSCCVCGRGVFELGSQKLSRQMKRVRSGPVLSCGRMLAHWRRRAGGW